MRADYAEAMTRWWMHNFWDDTLSAGVNLRRFREWWTTMYDDAPLPDDMIGEDDD